VIHLDTSALVDAFTGPRRSARTLRQILERGERIAVSALVLYEWRRGPRGERELAHLEDLLPEAQAVPFGPREASNGGSMHQKHPPAKVALAVSCALAGASTTTPPASSAPRIHPASRRTRRLGRSGG